MKFTSKVPRKSEKGQVLVIVALTLIALIAIMGLAIDTGYLYVSYSRLQRAVDAAALAGTGEFKPPTGDRDTRIKAAIQQMLDLNGVVPDPTAGFTGPLSTVPGIAIQTCDNTPGDPDLCKTPLQKVIRIKVQTRVQLFFLAVIGIYNVPISISSIASAASLDVMLALDTSDSMTYDVPDDSAMFDPAACNPVHSCEPMEHVKTAAKLFSDKLYYPYDRLGIVYFDQHAYIKLPLSTDSTTIKNAIDSLTVYEGQVGNKLADGSTTGTRCIYDRAHVNLDNRGAQDPVPPSAWPIDPAKDYASSAYGTCRLFTDNFAGFFEFDCIKDYGTNRNPQYCGRTNIAEGISVATRALLGDDTGYPTPWPDTRDDSILTMVLLTDGVANAAFSEVDGSPVCPQSTWLNGDGSQACRDHNAGDDSTNRHNSASIYYDADDMARDMFDKAIDENTNNILVYTIGLGSNVTKLFEGDTGTPPGETLLKYPSTKNPDDKYFPAPDSNALIPVFLAIADLITSRIKQ